jgi:hypothetical protein
MLMPIGFGPMVNLTETPRVPLKHKFKMKQKPLPKPKHWMKVRKIKNKP